MKQLHRFPLHWCWCCACLCSLLAAAQGAVQHGLPSEGRDQYLARAEAATRAGRFEEALAIYREMLRIEPRSGELWSNLGATQAGRCDEARAALDRAQSLNPRLFSPWYFAAYCELQAHRDERALRDIERALQINPRDANALHLKARAAADLETGLRGP